VRPATGPEAIRVATRRPAVLVDPVRTW